jgi:hypothetical protein
LFAACYNENKEGEVAMPRSNLSAALIALAAVGVSCGETHAQAALPGWKITDICAKESAPGQCADFERSALSAVSSSWTFVLEPIRQTCLAQAKSPSDQSWRLLAECIDGETLKALDKAAVQTAKTPSEPVPPPRPQYTPPALQIEIPPAPELAAPKPQ